MLASYFSPSTPHSYHFHSSSVDEEGSNLYIFGGSKLKDRDGRIEQDNFTRTNTLQILRLKPTSLALLCKRKLLQKDCQIKNRAFKVVKQNEWTRNQTTVRNVDGMLSLSPINEFTGLGELRIP